MYKKADSFVKHGICKDSRDRFVEQMNTIGTEKQCVPVKNVDFHYFKKRGSKDQITFELSSPDMKTAVVAYSGDWIEKVIVGSNALSLDALEIMLLREMETST